ncbi:response regulator [Paenibacillus sp. R14(2021)]|uniref:response regulator n=1 Tax=Paenibacillus sp. R14(2021) TaxID=2859228 RepID=UPI001C61674C|nr:response regulator [Paenibacillus sp. R14(2021)]
MITLLIVDDEPIERIALQRILETGLPEIAVVGQAANGREAIEAAALLKPDLITMDIKMPGMSGLQAIEAIQETNDTVTFIMVTAYDTFEFARQALRMGVRDYLLKPSKTAVVLDTIGKVAEEIKAARSESEVRRLDRERLRKMLPIVEADIVSQLLFDFVPSEHLGEMIELLGLPAMNGCFVMNVLLPGPCEDDGSTGSRAESIYANLVQQLETTAVPCWIGRLSGKQIPLLIFVDGAQSYRSYAVGLARKLVQWLHRKSGEEPFIGIGELYGSIMDMRKSYHESLLASVDGSLPARYCLYEDLERPDNPTTGSMAMGREKSVLEEVRRGYWEAALEGIIGIIDVYEGSGASIGMAQQRAFEVLIVITRMLQEMGIDVNNPYYPHQAVSYMQLKTETRVLVGQLAEKTVTLAEDMESDLLQTVKQYIRAHAHEDLSLERVAAQVNRNPFYMSKLFKSHFGLNYIDYLTECRMETAKQLMQETDKSLKEITFEIGYHDPNYFSRVFRKIVGCSPTDYRKMLLRPANKK